MTAFTDNEAAVDAWVPFGLEKRLRERGARFVAAPNVFEPYVVRDGKFLTGQNPASSRALAERCVHELISSVNS